ncbi:MAG: hypothetical protein IPG77_14010 [Betaproteobacteria bacterium]|mgnify:FL=1|jgi:uncharacterized membrane protein|nr:hypothetical protein [Betaproteobacteria bacterium]MBK8104672.1 hypothetical protein [Betaproteobacteria bacterium]
MHLVAIAWIYVVLMMALAEALSSQGTVLGAVITFVLYGLLPLSVLLYIMGAPARGRARRTAEAAAVPTAAPSATPDGGGMAPGDAVAPEGKEA